MEVIELECPSCQDELEIDAGFAGGVCRCSSCGTLMTVPEDAADGTRPETLARPDRPDAPVQLDIPEDKTTQPKRQQKVLKPKGTSANPNRNVNPSDKSKPQFASMAQIDLGQGNVLVTKSGRKIVLDGNIPTAGRRRRPIVRAITYMIFIAFIAAVVIGPLIALSIIMTDGTGGETEDIGRVDPTVNPLISGNNTLLSMPLASRSTIVVDASGYSQPWLDRFNKALQISLARLNTQKKVQVIYWTEGKLIAFPRDRHIAFGRTDRGQLQQIMQDEVFPIGSSELVPMVTRAAQQVPHQILIITGQRFGEREVDQLKAAMLESNIAIPIDLMVIGGRAESPEFQDFITDNTRGTRPGMYVLMNQSRMDGWIREWENAATPDEVADVVELPAMPPLPEEEVAETDDANADDAAADDAETEQETAAPAVSKPTPLLNADTTSRQREKQDEDAAKAKARAEAAAKAKADAAAKAKAEAEAEAEAEEKANTDAEADSTEAVEATVEVQEEVITSE